MHGVSSRLDYGQTGQQSPREGSQDSTDTAQTAENSKLSICHAVTVTGVFGDDMPMPRALHAFPLFP